MIAKCVRPDGVATLLDFGLAKDLLTTSVTASDQILGTASYLAPELTEAHYQLGMALLNEGNMTGAVTAFEKYLQLAPEGQFAAQAKAMLAQLKK